MHPLAKEIIESNYKNTPHDNKALENCIRQWLKEKAVEIVRSYGVGANATKTPGVYKILDLQEPSLAEKFEKIATYKSIDGFAYTIQKDHLESLVQIAEEHFKEK